MLERFSAFLDRLARLPYWQLGLLVLMLASGLAAGYLFLRSPSRPQSDFHAAEDTAQPDPLEITVHVAGAVYHPGVYRLLEGDRVVDALQEAGGPLDEADLDGLNLAQEVGDGQKIVVPLQGEQGTEAAEDGAEEKVNLNRAGRGELEELPGIGPTLAGRIIAYRDKKGGFGSVEELMQVTGIGEKKFAELRDLVEI